MPQKHLSTPGKQARRSLGQALDKAMIPIPPPRHEMTDGFGPLLDELKKRIAPERVRVVLAANSAMVLPTIGLLLCRGKSHVAVEYALRDLTNPVGVTDWEADLVSKLPASREGSLPTVEQLEAELRLPDIAKQPNTTRAARNSRTRSHGAKRKRPRKEFLELSRR